MKTLIAALLACAVAFPAAAQPPSHHKHYRSDWYKRDWPRPHYWPRPRPYYDNPLGAFLGGVFGGFLANRLRDKEDYEDDRPERQGD